MKKQIESKLVSKLFYSSASASKTAEDLCNITYPDLKKGVLEWLKTDTQNVIRDAPYSTNFLMEKYHMTYPGALIFLNWYREDPKTAISILKMRM